MSDVEGDISRKRHCSNSSTDPPAKHYHHDDSDNDPPKCIETTSEGITRPSSDSPEASPDIPLTTEAASPGSPHLIIEAGPDSPHLIEARPDMPVVEASLDTPHITAEASSGMPLVEASPGMPLVEANLDTPFTSLDMINPGQVPIGGSSEYYNDGVMISNTDGFSLRLRLKSNKEMEKKKQRAVSSSLGGQLLFVPFHKLQEEVEEKRYKQLMEESEVMEQSLNRRSESRLADTSIEGEGQRQQLQQNVLWSDKYSPKSFTDLLSDDGINRTVLSWVKLWDETVFGSTAHLLRDSTNKKIQKDFKNVQAPPTKKFKPTQWEVQDPEYFATDKALDDARRPKQKLFLLCGPPGLGKTTLAHIVAKHAGYNVVELNASDDRSPDVFKRVLESTTEMQAVLTSNTRPNCLVIDEIDGAPANAINVLLDVIKAKNTKGGKRAKKSKGSLSRPIICICNDLYTPSLRTLRQVATVVPVPQTLSSRLASRLLEICKHEHMSASGSVLTALCEKTDNDIRTCLNTLQFIHKKHGELTMSSIQNASIGKKDVQKGHLTFLKDVFKLPTMTNKATLYNEDVKSDHISQQSLRFMSILSSAYSTGEYDKVLQGLYENYLESKIRDSSLDILSSIQDWVIFYEKVNTQVLSSQEYAMMSYLPFLSVAFHFHFATTTGLRVKYPRSDFEAFQSYQKNQQIASSLVSDISPSVRGNSSSISTVDFIPLLIQIITPSFRPVNPQLYTKWEKQILSNVIGTMTSYNLTYHQDQTPDGQYTYIMDPNIEQLSTFTTSVQRKQLPYVTKQMLSREIELQKVKGELKPEDNSPMEESESQQTSATTTLKDNTSKDKPVLKMMKQRPKRDFFGRPIAPKAPADPNSTSDGGNAASKLEQTLPSVLSTSLWFKFNQGFSDAVKRPVKMKDLV